MWPEAQYNVTFAYDVDSSQKFLRTKTDEYALKLAEIHFQKYIKIHFDYFSLW